jgi:RNA polymerase sigma-70 factor (ECF subfamily)
VEANLEPARLGAVSENDAPGSDEAAEVPVPAATLDREAAFRQYVVPEMDVLFRVARSLTRRDADAEDLVQDTLVRAYRAIDRFDGRYPRSWLLTILRNTNINNTRKKRPELVRDPDDPTIPDEADTSPSSADPERAAIDASIDPVLVDAYHALPKKFRDAVELVDIDGLTYQEAAGLLGIPVGTVMSRLHRARTRMRKHLEARRESA